MKKLFITRHAKSDWSVIGQLDFDRTLNNRGMNDAPMMGKRIADKNMEVELILSSTAKRAEQTAILIANEMYIDTHKIHWIPALYHASASTITEQLLAVDNQVNSVMIVCHNTGLTDFVNQQCGIITDNVPTCGIVCFDIETTEWEQFPLAKKRLVFYDFPKKGEIL